ncbi:MAG: hypothetical protein ABH883_03120 [Candidatus Omnitrophota bacterium]
MVPAYMMEKKARGAKGFTLIEIAIILTAISILLTIAVSNYADRIKTANKALCAETCRVVEQAEQRYAASEGTHSLSFQDLVDKGYIKAFPRCPSGGVYAWAAFPATSSDYRTVLGCSLHSAPAAEDTAKGK